MPYVIKVGLGLLKLKQEAPRLIILDEFGICLPTITTTASRHHHLLAPAVTEVLHFIILILREKEGEGAYGEDDDIVIRVI